MRTEKKVLTRPMLLCCLRFLLFKQSVPSRQFTLQMWKLFSSRPLCHRVACNFTAWNELENTIK
jgi:hypothetical protein